MSLLRNVTAIANTLEPAPLDIQFRLNLHFSCLPRLEHVSPKPFAVLQPGEARFTSSNSLLFILLCSDISVNLR